ncbi:hypothetical protein CUJ84_Chr003761 [Rhizobium leguminosarum]|uniref:Uncharacterized protein n=1 Tax=Rhizobium leguminosarum TaxID=384 RepID=A0A2K9Z779_RHILE|nr:hypothetical protein CUJ84_Chr003761 [Rhizobium leguminosarum]
MGKPVFFPAKPFWNICVAYPDKLLLYQMFNCLSALFDSGIGKLHPLLEKFCPPKRPKPFEF